MADKFGVVLEDYKLTSNQIALIEWCKSHPHAQIELKIGASGEPTVIVMPTSDGIGKQTILFSDIIKRSEKGAQVS